MVRGSILFSTVNLRVENEELIHNDGGNFAKKLRSKSGDLQWV